MKKCRADTVFYNIGKIIWIPVLLAGIWFAKAGFEKYGGLFECSIRLMTGVPCPGCGGTRAFYYLFAGDPVKSLCYHPAVLFGIFFYLHFMGLYFYRAHVSRTLGEKEIHMEFYVYGAAAVIIIQWILKMIFFFRYLC